MKQKKVLDSLRAENFNFKKKYGQNFIFDENILKNIVSKIAITKKDLVLEVGAGSGSLTKLLAREAKKVITYEIDEKLATVLESNLAKEKINNVEIKYQDFLKIDFAEYANTKKEYQNIILIGNLPYVITSPLLFKILHEGNIIDKMLLMVQKEVAMRILAKPRTKEYNATSVLLQYFFQIKKEKEIRREVFFPVPKVDSVVLSLQRKKSKTADDDWFVSFVKKSFSQKRKTLKNNLKDNVNIDLEKIADELEKEGYSLNTRAEFLSVATFERLAKEGKK